MDNATVRREIVIAAALFGIGFFVLPFAIYWVGQSLVGEYAEGAGVLDLAEHIWSDLLYLRPTAWILVLSPYAVVQLVRLIAHLWRGSRVSTVTNRRSRA